MTCSKSVVEESPLTIHVFQTWNAWTSSLEKRYLIQFVMQISQIIVCLALDFIDYSLRSQFALLNIMYSAQRVQCRHEPHKVQSKALRCVAMMAERTVL